VLGRTELRQLAQRITGRYHLEALTRPETLAYVRHRMRVAGATSDIFTAGALREVHRLSGGIPRIINVICDRALLGAFTREEHGVSGGLIRQAASEVYGRPMMAPWVSWASAAAGVAGIAMLAAVLWKLWPAPQADVPAIPTATVAGPAQAEAVSAPPVAAPKGPPAEPMLRDLAAILALAPGETTTNTAFTQLLGLWGASYDPAAGRPCDQVADQGLQCVADFGSFAQLQLINRPAILSLTDAMGAEHQVVLESLTGNLARIAVGEARYDISMAELAAHWFGEYLVVWRPSIPLAKQLSLGMRGDEVRWLREALSQLEGTPVNTPRPEVFDATLVRLVEDFQRSRRLTADGIAGVKTQLVLDSALGAPGTPTLDAVGDGDAA